MAEAGSSGDISRVLQQVFEPKVDEQLDNFLKRFDVAKKVERIPHIRSMNLKNLTKAKTLKLQKIHSVSKILMILLLARV